MTLRDPQVRRLVATLGPRLRESAERLIARDDVAPEVKEQMRALLAELEETNGT